MQKIFDANATKALGMGEYKLNDLINFAREIICCNKYGLK